MLGEGGEKNSFVNNGRMNEQNNTSVGANGWRMEKNRKVVINSITKQSDKSAESRDKNLIAY